MTTDQFDAATAAQFTGEDPTQVWPQVRHILEAAMMNTPRSLQKQIGPSELGVECDQCLANMLAGTPKHPEAAWLPQIGTAVHAWAEMVMLAHEFTRADLGMGSRYLPETRVTVGNVNGIPITGSIDLFDIASGTVIDYKIVGTTTLKKSKAHGASVQYQRQGMLYAKGMEDAGYTVTSVAILFLPRNSISLSEAYPWQAPYNRQTALDTLEHADSIAKAIAALGLDQTLAAMPGHTFEGFSCKKFATPPTTTNGAPFGDV